MSNKKYKIVITECDHGFIDQEISVFKGLNAEVTLANVNTDEELIEKCRTADGIIVQYASITDKILKELKNCKVISRYGVGVDTIDLDAATRHGVIIAYVPDYSISEVALHATSLLMAFYRKIFIADHFVKSGVWDYQKLDPIINSRKTVIGILGLGRIGAKFAKNMIALGFRVIAHDPEYVRAVKQVEMVEFETVIRESDFISIHCHLGKDTYHLLGKQEFIKMKKNAVIINTARGNIIDEKALALALENKIIAGAAIDVLELEPPTNNSPLLKMNNVIITPHSAWFSVESRVELKRRTADNVALVLEKKLPRHIANPKVLGKERANIYKRKMDNINHN